MYWKDNEGSYKSRLKAGEPSQTVALVYMGRHGYVAEGFARKRTVFRKEGISGKADAQRCAEAWARRNGFD